MSQRIAVLPILAFLFCSSLSAQFDLGLGYDFGSGSSGTLVGDMHGYAIFGRYDLSPKWKLFVGVGELQYDLEEPISVLRISPRPGDDSSDSFTTVTTIELSTEYSFSQSSLGEWVLGFGIEYFMPDVADAAGVTDDGEPFVIVIDAPDSLGVSLKFGYSFSVTERFHIDTLARFAQSFDDWKVRSEVSGETGAISAFAPLGLTLRVGYTF